MTATFWINITLGEGTTRPSSSVRFLTKNTPRVQPAKNVLPSSKWRWTCASNQTLLSSHTKLAVDSLAQQQRPREIAGLWAVRELDWLALVARSITMTKKKSKTAKAAIKSSTKTRRGTKNAQRNGQRGVDGGGRSHERTCLWTKFPENRELTGKFSEYCPLRANLAQNSSPISVRYGRFPCISQQGI